MMTDHHAAERGLPVRTPDEIRDHINSDHPCCIGVGDACALLAEVARLREIEACPSLYVNISREVLAALSDARLAAVKRAEAAEAEERKALREIVQTAWSDAAFGDGLTLQDIAHHVERVLAALDARGGVAATAALRGDEDEASGTPPDPTWEGEKP